MGEKPDNQSLWPVLDGQGNKNRYSKIMKNEDISSSFTETAFNTNAKIATTSPDRLKKLFAERQSHRVLAEQKVSDWLLKYRSYSHIPPKDMTDIPDNLWSPQEVESDSKNNSAVDYTTRKHDKESTDDKFEKKFKRRKSQTENSGSWSQV